MKDVCPVCNGVTFKGWGNHNYDFPLIKSKIILEVDFVNLVPERDRYVCAACAGKGTATAHAARVLAGDYPLKQEVEFYPKGVHPPF